MENLLCSEDPANLNVLISDFGLSRGFDNFDGMNTQVGSLEYTAPEVISVHNPKYNQMCDLWSLGVVTFILYISFLFKLSIFTN